MTTNNTWLTDDLLWDYADGFLAADERQRVEEYLQQYPAERPRLTAIMAEKQALASIPMEQTKRGFADRTMALWVSEQVKSGQLAVTPRSKNDRIVYLIMGILCVLLLLPFLTFLGSSPETTTVTTPLLKLPQMQQPDWTDPELVSVLRYAFVLISGIIVTMFFEKWIRLRHVFGSK